MKPTEAWKTFFAIRLWAYLLYMPIFLLAILQVVVFSLLWTVTLGNKSYFKVLRAEVNWHMKAMGWLPE